MTARLLLLALAVLAARPAMAQYQEYPQQPPPAGSVEEATPPPPPAAAERPIRPMNPLHRVPRISVELLLGGASALGLAYGGWQLGCALGGGGFGSSNCVIAGFYGGAAGLTLGIPIGVMLGGALLDGDGAILPTIFGTGLGVITTLGVLFVMATIAPGVDPAPALVIPLVFGVVGYELSSHDSRAAWQAESRGKRLSLRIAPSAAVTRAGASFGLLMVLP